MWQNEKVRHHVHFDQFMKMKYSSRVAATQSSSYEVEKFKNRSTRAQCSFLLGMQGADLNEYCTVDTP